MLFDLEATSRAVTIPKALEKRVRTLAKEDEDLLTRDWADYESRCLLQHYRRVWQKLSAQERTLLLKQNADCSEYDIFRKFAQILRAGKSDKNQQVARVAR